MSLRGLYKPSLDEAARQAFVGALKACLNGPLEAQLEQRYEQHLAPQFAARHGRKPARRDEALPLFESEPLFQLWASMVYTSQDLLWETTGETLERLRDRLEARVSTLVERTDKRGDCRLDPALVPPFPIADVDVHRQPGGYFHQSRAQDVTAPVLYLGAVETYRAAKGLGAVGEPGDPMVGRYLAALVDRYAPDLNPARVLDLGCAEGVQTVAYARCWPKAEIHGLDLSAPFVRFAHAWAEDSGVAITFHQMNAARMNFPDDHFDLIVSHIVCHETWDDVLVDMLAQTHRVLRPGGLFLSLEVPYQTSVTAMTKQVTNHWQVSCNGEPFWTRFAEKDLRKLLADAGFAVPDIFCNYEPMGSARMVAFGGRKRS